MYWLGIVTGVLFLLDGFLIVTQIVLPKVRRRQRKPRFALVDRWTGSTMLMFSEPSEMFAGDRITATINIDYKEVVP